MQLELCSVSCIDIVKWKESCYSSLVGFEDDGASLSMTVNKILL